MGDLVLNGESNDAQHLGRGRDFCDHLYDRSPFVRMAMSLEWLAALAAAGGTALVEAAATDAWQMARDGYARLLGRGDEDHTRLTESRLDELAVRVESAGPETRAEVRAQALTAWQVRLADLLEERPEAEAELRDLVARVEELVPAAAGQIWIQRNTASDHGTVNAVQHGSQHVYRHSPRNPA
ncbi:hypothetical protein [Nonomuraea sp. NPDC050202]|jgi:hypothetical protein|uniref:hypothetical protein n=1 Tax=Nonomuraea sp. NPDC050202 TaxID=3155035 RepID=UPI0033DFC606